MLPQIKKILYATDLKEEQGTDQAFRMAVSMAMSHDAQLIILHVMESISSAMLGILSNSMSEEEIEEFKNSAYENQKAQLKKRLDDFCDQECPNDDHTYPGGEPVTLVEEGDPSRVILKQAQKNEVDLILMGTRTHTEIGQFFLGSIANKVIHHSKVPVMVYPL
jgi:nucleotide-binding universal stress UspA family protein